MTDAPATNPPKLCACQEAHGFPCQFPDAPATYHFDGKDWCMFHLPLIGKIGKLSEKTRWIRNGQEWKVFADKVGDIIRTASKDTSVPSTRANLCGLVFPYGFAILGTDTNEQINVNFAHATFSDGVRFICAGFHDYADFTSAQFEGSINFSDFAFGDKVSFSDARFMGPVDFAALGTRWEAADRDFTMNRISFSGATFEKKVSFDNRAFKSSACFSGVLFEDLVEFHGCTFHQGMSFHNTEFHKTHGGYDAEGFENDAETEALERSYRTLKLGMETLRARNEEAYFFAKEMECRRHRSDIGFFAWLAATVYKHLSSYGRSILRPVLWLSGLTLFMWGVYFTIGFLTLPATSNPAHDTYYVVVEPWRAARFTLEQMFRPFAIWSSPINEDVPVNPDDFSEAFTRPEKTYPRLYGILIPILASVQSLATIGLLTLFLLALRRRFKMD